MASLLPSSSSEFRSKGYWNDFFVQREQNAGNSASSSSTFEWYGSWSDVQDIVHRYAIPASTATALVVGCGNSSTSEEMFDSGYSNVASIDFSEVVIKEMSPKSKEGLTFEVMDMLDMTYGDGTFDLVFDKGALDALMSDDSEQSKTEAGRMFSEISRVLSSSGSYICITLAQKHIMAAFFRFFFVGWKVNVHSFEPSDGSALCPFVFVVTKDATLALPAINTHLQGTLKESVTLSDAMAAVREVQITYNRLGGRLRAGSRTTLQLWAGQSKHKTPRFNVTVIDTKVHVKSQAGPCAVFIVPQGQEHKWMFASEEGQLQLAEGAGFGRFVIVTLNRSHDFSDMTSVQAELSPYMQKLAPPGAEEGGRKIPFMTIGGDDIGERDMIGEGESQLTGEYFVEETTFSLTGRRSRARRLVFADSGSTIQSEALLKLRKSQGSSGESAGSKKKNRKGGKKKKKKNRNKNSNSNSEGGGSGGDAGGFISQYTVDHGYLMFEFHSVMVAGLALLPRALEGGASKTHNISIIGLGGGCLPMFLHNHFSQLNIDAVEIDGDLVDAAKRYFDFRPSARLSVHVMDGLDYVRQLAASAPAEGMKKDMIIFDVDNKDVTTGVTAPPASFLEPDFLQATFDALDEDGILAVNLAARSQRPYSEAMNALRGKFNCIHEVNIEGDVNRIVWATKSAKVPELAQVERRVLELSKSIRSRKWHDSIDLLESIESIDLDLKPEV
eukprot:g4448.t1